MQKTTNLFTLIILAIVSLLSYFMAVNTPTTFFTQFSGLTAFMLLCITLIIGPLVVLNPKVFAPLLEPRRSIGIITFVFVLIHFFSVLIWGFQWNFLLIFNFPPIVIGFFAAVLMSLLFLTSNDYSMRKLGKWWKRIHRLNYIIFILAFIHFVWMSGILLGFDQLNIVEFIMMILGIITIILQVSGFVKRKRMSSNKSNNV